MAEQRLIAVDLGASSGRSMLGRYDGRRLGVETIDRFENVPATLGSHMYWDILYLWRRVQESLYKAGEQPVAGLGLNTWGNDFGLLDAAGNLVANPLHYRDEGAVGMMEEVFKKVPRRQVFDATGIQFMRFNALYQLYGLYRRAAPALQIAKTLLLIPDLLVYLLTGEKAAEFTNATTTQMFSPGAMDWAKDMLQKLGIDTGLFLPVAAPGSVVGPLRGEVRQIPALREASVIHAAQHDTASAVLSVPAASRDFVFISSGTWSLMGVELDAPMIDDKCYRYNFTNEGGAYGSWRLLKNVMGLWILQECRRAWAQRGEEVSFDEMDQATLAAEPFTCFIDPDDDRFGAPGSMPEKVAAYCRETGQPEPKGAGAIVRCVSESLAMKYRYVLDCIEDMCGRRYENIHIVGGGVKNLPLCSFTARATGRRVLAGPVEATAIGNLAVQGITLGQFGDIWQARQLVRESFEIDEYAPDERDGWEDAYGAFLRVTKLERPGT